MRKIAIENSDEHYTDDNAGLMAASSSETLPFEREAETFDDYTQKVVILFKYLIIVIVFFFS